MRRSCALLFALAFIACGGTYHPAPPPVWEARTAEAPHREEGSAESPALSGAASGAESPAAPFAEYEGRAPVRVLTGRASYYHDSLAGNHTANGETYDLTKRTAASRDLPFGTIIRVVRTDTGATVIVRVNDRGPFGDHRRILDLSRAAAEAIDMVRAGVVPIRAEILHIPEP